MRLPVILVGELMAGMALGVVWPQLTAPPLPVPQTAMTAVTVPVPVPAVPAPAPTAIPVVTHAPRNPFGAPDGIDTSAQRPAAPVATAVTTVPVGPPPGLVVPTAPYGPGDDPFAGANTPAR